VARWTQVLEALVLKALRKTFWLVREVCMQVQLARLTADLLLAEMLRALLAGLRCVGLVLLLDSPYLV
jgi:hypothetical protein